MRWLALVAVAACGGGNPATPDAVPPAPDAEIATEIADPVAVVDPTIGTGGLGFAHGSCFVGAAAPHGMVKLGPDTSGPYATANFLHFSGYWAGDTKIRGFSHLHLHGAGAMDYGVLSVMPTLAFDAGKTSVVDYETKFAKADEHASVGRYAVTLANGIGVELTATPRAAMHRYTMPAAGTVLVDLAKALGDDAVMSAQTYQIGGDGEIAGSLHAKGGMTGAYGGYTLYFVLRSSAPITAAGVVQAATAFALPVPAGPTTISIGLSYVSIAGARANLAAEIGARAFDDVIAQTRAAWSAKLGAATITATQRDARIFYTSLYHAFLMPSVIDDADGTYRLAGMAATATATGYHQVSDQSLWDTYRTVIPLYGWLAPDSARDAARSLVGFADGTGAYPRWPIAIGESGTMLGASAEIAIADTIARGVPGGVDAAGAWPLLRGEAMDATAPAGGRGERDAVDDYLAHGYVTLDAHGRSASTTTEYAHDDFALATIAAAAGDAAAHDALLARSHGWQALYDPAAGFIRAKTAAGAFPAGAFDPLKQIDDYAEANAWQSLWMVGIHDPDTLATVLGGRAAALAKLGAFFAMTKADLDSGEVDPTGALPPNYYWHGNEPDLNAPFLFGQWGDRASGETWTAWVEDTYYGDGVDGVAGNDDGGTLGSWYVLAALGVFPIAGSDGWLVGAPRFAHARVGALEITTEGTGVHVASATLDGAALDLGAPLPHARLAAAHALHFVLAQ